MSLSPATFLPIVSRELRVAARRRGTYWNRTLAAIVAIAIFVLLSLDSFQVAPRDLGQILFSVLAILFGLVATVSGVRYTADCLSREKREGTLGLLFLTDLRGYDVVLGKLAATSLNALYGLLAILPVLALTLLLGGVSLGQFGRASLVLLNALFFSLNAGLLVSSLSRDARKAMSGTLLLIVLIAGGLPALGSFLSGRVVTAHWVTWLFLPSPAFALGLAHDFVYATQPSRFWLALGTSHLVAWLFLVGACLAAPYTWQDPPAGRRRQLWHQRALRLLSGSDAANRAFRAELLNINPCLWLGARHRLRPVWTWASLLVIVALWCADWLKRGTEMLEIEGMIFTAFLAHLVIKLALTSEACQRLGPERRNNTLELVLSTPLSVREILRGQLLVLRHQFFKPVLAVLAFDLALVTVGFRDSSNWSESAWASFALVGVGSFLADLYTLAWVGLWTGLTARHANRAAGTVVARVLILPWLVWLGCILAVEFNRRAGNPGSGFFLFSWLLVGLVNNALFLTWSRYRLHHDLRALASPRGEPASPSSWARLFGVSTSRPAPIPTRSAAR